jgi:hypothetical protein
MAIKIDQASEAGEYDDGMQALLQVMCVPRGSVHPFQSDTCAGTPRGSREICRPATVCYYTENEGTPRSVAPGMDHSPYGSTVGSSSRSR